MGMSEDMNVDPGGHAPGRTRGGSLILHGFRFGWQLGWERDQEEMSQSMWEIGAHAPRQLICSKC